ncbi:SpoIIE family protein phosphatase [Bernardetia sp. ABR2-2B]|uniref:SpoIIE family protein phosphatase n=1 Tax=Bernardetia sp. ABR2-2B TaxID=3127472 RepID=UPI0030CED232
MIKYIYLLLFTLFSITPLFAQVGTPPMTGFAPNEYNGAPDIRAIMQSKRGFLYASSTGGNLLEYDGISWKRIAVPCSHINTLVEDKNGNIFFGDMFFSCAAYLRPNKTTGQWETVPINLDLPDSIIAGNNFGIRVRQINGEIYCILRGGAIGKDVSSVYQFKNGKFIPLPLKSASTYTFITQKGIFNVKAKNKVDLYDLNGIKKDSLQIDIETEPSEFYQFNDYSEDEILFLTVFDNLWKYNFKTKETSSFFPSDVTQTLKAAQPLNFNILTNGNIAIGTVQKGVFIVDKNGNIIKNISTAEGLRDNIVMATTQDKQNQLWTALYNGINRIDINAPLSVWTKENGILGSTTHNIVKYKDTYFAATISNVVFFDKNENTWKPVKGTNIENFIAGILTLSDQKEHLFIGNINGLQEVIKDNKEGWIAKNIIESNRQLRLRTVTNHPSAPNKIYAWGLANLGYFKYNEPSNELKRIEALEGVRVVSGLTQRIENSIWTIAVEKQQPVRIELPTEKMTIIPYDTAFVTLFDGKLVLAKSNLDSVFTLDKNNQKVYDKNISNLLKPYRNSTIGFQEDSLGSLWVFNPQEFFINVLRKTENGYQRDNLLEQSLGKYVIRGIYSDSNDKQIVWVSTTEGVLRVNMSKSEVQTDNQANFSTYIRQIKIGQDSLIFDGNFFELKKLENDSTQYTILANQPKNQVIELDFINNSIAFQVAAPFFIEEKQIQFAYFLEGLDEKWSDWTKLSVKEYNNLKEGKYTLHVKAKNYLSTESTETTYQFKVLPPWHRTTIAYILYFVFGVGLIFGSTRFYTHRLRQQNEQLENLVSERTDELYQKNAELSTQNEEIVQQRDQLDVKNQHIAEQNKNIVSSINYAKRIQTALLPMEKRIKQEIPEHFIFYKPRDIVSGDFYWIEKIEDKVIIAVSDCTGHGVPGAFMSMLGSSGLTDAVFQQNLTSPDLILTHLHNYIYSALKQSQSDNRDGMDICIVVWDKTKNQIQYAGAMNPLYYVQNEEFLQIKADKIPVGGTMAKERVYTPHTINLHVPTTIYLASDGYQDQFGGKDNRKFMTKRFRELLLEISHLPIKEQENRISQVFERWKENTHQIDDVLVMGMRIG